MQGRVDGVLFQRVMGYDMIHVVQIYDFYVRPPS